MSRRPALFTEADLYRAARAAKRAGAIAEAMPDGRIRLIPVDYVEPVVVLPVEDEPARPLC
jgi:hypothetical protein